MSSTETLLTTEQVAERLAISSKTLANWRALNKGPNWIKLGGAVRYHPKDVEDWIKEREYQNGGRR